MLAANAEIAAEAEEAEAYLAITYGLHSVRPGCPGVTAIISCSSADISDVFPATMSAMVLAGSMGGISSGAINLLHGVEEIGLAVQ